MLGITRYILFGGAYMKTGEEYRQSLRERNIKVYVMGELVEGAAVIDLSLIHI